MDERVKQLGQMSQIKVANFVIITGWTIRRSLKYSNSQILIQYMVLNMLFIHNVLSVNISVALSVGTINEHKCWGHYEKELPAVDLDQTTLFPQPISNLPQLHNSRSFQLSRMSH